MVALRICGGNGFTDQATELSGMTLEIENEILGEKMTAIGL